MFLYCETVRSFRANRDAINPEDSLGISVRRNGSDETSNTRGTTEKFSATFMQDDPARNLIHRRRSRAARSRENPVTDTRHDEEERTLVVSRTGFYSPPALPISMAIQKSDRAAVTHQNPA